MRRDARVVGFQIIVSHLFAEQPQTEALFANLKKEADIQFAKELQTAFCEHRQDLEAMVDKNLVGYERSRVYKLDLALLYLALTEIFYIKTPYQVAINEVCDIAKKFSTANSSRFINGVLSQAIKGLE